MKGLLLKIVIAVAVFFSFIYFNYSRAQKTLNNPQQTIFTINLVNTPSVAKVGEPIAFTWKVDAPNNFQTSHTTIYYGSFSNPGILTKFITPQDLKYSVSSSDYLGSKFYLPDTFTLNYSFSKPQRIWFRAYAKIGEDNLWSEERYLDITP